MNAILLFKGNDLVSRLIRWWSRSTYSHAAILVNETVIESYPGIGVRTRKWNTINRSEVDIFQIKDASFNWEKAAIFCWKEIGCKYDWRAIFGFIARTKARQPSVTRWICSELVYASVREGGIELLARVEPIEVSPAMIGYSTLLQLTP